MPGDGGHILVVDDNRLNRMKLSRTLELQGRTVATAEDGQQALEMLGVQSFDVVLLDIIMPTLDGHQVLERMKQDDVLRDIPVIVISALEEMESVIRCIEMGAEDYLPKSYDPVLLRARIGSCLEKKRLREAVVRQLGKYVPESVGTAIIRGGVGLEPTRTTATVLYSDIEGFTSIAEKLSPEQVFEMLNEYFPTVIEPIVRNGGVVNQFQGDAMLVTFNVPVKEPAHADNALRAATEIQRVVKNKTFADIHLKTRIGISTGEVIAGNVGTGAQHNYTVHGDAVNL
ncbi:MAG: adenylate/guanylate cyclase domain-containing protein, partial [Gammaproteobacteria bacterium]